MDTPTRDINGAADEDAGTQSTASQVDRRQGGSWRTEQNRTGNEQGVASRWKCWHERCKARGVEGGRGISHGTTREYDVPAVSALSTHLPALTPSLFEPLQTLSVSPSLVSSRPVSSLLSSLSPLSRLAMSSSDSTPSTSEPKLQEIPFRQDKVREPAELSARASGGLCSPTALPADSCCCCVCACRTWTLVRCRRRTATSSQPSERSRRMWDRPKPSAETTPRSALHCTAQHSTTQQPSEHTALAHDCRATQAPRGSAARKSKCDQASASPR